ncbi:MAG: hypothetical protein KDK63_01545 [Chlamydiia bacterium]|nr:hypothetical protein [Chlamydiia bacterium]MCB1116521.1 hypothetical protein [Chlamydiia bacterium]
MDNSWQLSAMIPFNIDGFIGILKEGLHVITSSVLYQCFLDQSVVFSALILPYLYLMHTPQLRKLHCKQETRLGNVYHELYASHRKEIGKLHLFWGIIWLLYLICWALKEKIESYHLPEELIFLSVGFLGFFYCFLKGEWRANQTLKQLTKRGVQVESRMQGRHYFEKFARKQRGLRLALYILIRLAPVIFILGFLGHLIKWGALNTESGLFL